VLFVATIAAVIRRFRVRIPGGFHRKLTRWPNGKASDYGCFLAQVQLPSCETILVHFMHWWLVVRHVCSSNCFVVSSCFLLIKWVLLHYSTPAASITVDVNTNDHDEQEILVWLYFIILGGGNSLFSCFCSSSSCFLPCNPYDHCLLVTWLPLTIIRHSCSSPLL
jgi:hypothetical protein